jgi:hypothetical protein
MLATRASLIHPFGEARLCAMSGAGVHHWQRRSFWRATFLAEDAVLPLRHPLGRRDAFSISVPSRPTTAYRESETGALSIDGAFVYSYTINQDTNLSLMAHTSLYGTDKTSCMWLSISPNDNASTVDGNSAKMRSTASRASVQFSSGFFRAVRDQACVTASEYEDFLGIAA